MASGLRARIEDRFRQWGYTVSRRPIPVLFASLALALFCSAGLPRVWVDVTFESFLHSDDPVALSYEAFRAQFGRDDRIIASVEPGISSGPNGVFDPAFLERLRSFHEAIEERVPYVDEITSLVNARDTRGDEDTLRVEDFLDPWPNDEDALQRLRGRALANPLFLNTLLSADAAITTVVLDIQLYSSIGMTEDDLGGFGEDTETAASDPFETSELSSGANPDGRAMETPPVLTGAETAELVAAFHEVVDEFQSPDFVIHLGGSVVMLQDVATSMFHDMPRFVGLALLSIASLLFLLFRRVVAVVTPLVVVGLSLTSTIGLMGWAGIPLHVPTQILPSFLLAVGVGDAVHLLSIFFARIRVGEERDEALAHALGHSGLAIVLTSLTTAGGLASFATSGIAPVSAIGIFAPMGVLIALVLSLTLLPALLTIVPLGRSLDKSRSSEGNRIDDLLASGGRFAISNARGILISTSVLALIAVIGVSRLGLSHDPLTWLPQDADVVQGTRYIDRVLGGSMSFEVLLQTEESGGVRQPETLGRLAELGAEFEYEPHDGLIAGQSTSLADVVKEIHRALNEDRQEAYTIPDDAKLVSQELLLFENTGTEELEDLVDSEYRIARMSVRMPWRDAVRYTTFFDLAAARIDEVLHGVGTSSMTGVLALLVRSINALLTSMVSSYLLAFGIITPLMVLLLGNLRTGLIAMIPNAMPILLTLGLMGYFQFPLDAFSLLIGGIALGLAVDDTIHFMHNYRRHREAGDDLETSVVTTLRTTGRAMLITTIVLSMGFLGFVLSSMNNLKNLGILVSFAITMALIADVLLAPALLTVLDRNRDTRGNRST
jgi:uncharacterized protein